MSSIYPTGIDAFTDVVDGVTIVDASYINNLQDSVVALENFVGTTGSTRFFSYQYASETILVTGTITNGFITIPLSHVPLSAPAMTALFATGSSALGFMTNLVSNPIHNYPLHSGIIYGASSWSGVGAGTYISGSTWSISGYPKIGYNYPSFQPLTTSSLTIDPSGVCSYYCGSNFVAGGPLGVEGLGIGISQVIVNTGTVTGFSGDGGSAAGAHLSNARGVAYDPFNNIYISDNGNHRIRVVSSGIINTYAGNGNIPTGVRLDGVAATGVPITPTHISSDDSGNIYFVDGGNILRKIDTSGIIHNILNPSGVNSYTGDGSQSSFATCGFLGVPFPLPSGQGILVPDSGNHTIRLINATGTINTIVGLTGVSAIISGTSPTGVAALGAALSIPGAIATDGINYFVYNAGSTSGLTYFSGTNPLTVYPLTLTKGFTTEYVAAPVIFQNPYASALPSGLSATENIFDPSNMTTTLNVLTNTNGSNNILGFYTGTNNISIFFRSATTTGMQNGVTKPYSISARYFYMVGK